MKYCLINHLYGTSADGGAEAVVREEARRLQTQGHAVIIIATSPWGGWGSWRAKKAMEEGIAVYRYWAPNLSWYGNLSHHGVVLRALWHVKDVWNWWSKKIVQKILKLERPDIVHTHNLMGIGFGIPRLIQRMGMRHIHTLHDIQLVEPSGVLPWNHAKDSSFQRLYQWLMKRRFGKPDVVIALSKFLKEFYQTRGFFSGSKWNHFFVIPSEVNSLRPKSEGVNAVEGSFGLETVALPRSVQSPQMSASKDSSTRPRDSVGMTKINKNTKDSFLFVGSLVPHKGMQLLMHAWDALPPQFPGTLHIAGDGAFRDEIIAWAKKHPNVTYHGRVAGDGLSALYERSGVLLFPSQCIENRPRVIEEALSHGLWVIASRTGGVQELIQEGENGTLVKPDSLGEWIQNIFFHTSSFSDLSGVQIETDHLLLTPVDPRHREDIFREFSPDVTTYMYPRSAKDISETDAFIEESRKHLLEGTDLIMAVLKKDSKEFLGCVGLHNINTGYPELGIWIKVSAHGEGYGREAVTGLKKWCDERVPYVYILYPAAIENMSSRNIAESLGGIIARTYKNTNLSGRELTMVEYWIMKKK
ncbi:MAG: GNAT family N-acetyltransferase [Patescibacteria group bacterium]